MRRINPKPEFAMQQRVEQMWEKFEYPDIDPDALPFELAGGGGGDPTIFIACADATPQSKAMAHIIATGINDHDAYEQALGIILRDGPSWGGRIVISEGSFNVDPGVMKVTDIAHLHGLGAFRTAIQNQSDGTSTDALVEINGADGEVSNIGFNTTSTFAGRVLDSGYGRVSGIWHQGGAAAGLWVAGAQHNIDNIQMDGDYTDAAVVIDEGWVTMNNVSSLRTSTSGGGAFMRITSGTAQVSTISNLVVSHINSGVGHGIILEGPDSVSLSNFSISTPGNAAILIDDNTPFRLLLANGSLAGDYGITHQDSAGLVNGNFSNLVINPDLIGINLASMRESTISNVVIDSPGEHGVALDTCFDNILTGVLVIEPGQDTDNTFDGIFIEGNSDRNHIYGCKVTAPSAGNQPRYGINISAATCDNNAIYANYLGATANYGTGSFNDAGTGTLTAPAANGQFEF